MLLLSFSICAAVDAGKADLESNRMFTDTLSAALADDPYPYRQCEPEACSGLRVHETEQ